MSGLAIALCRSILFTTGAQGLCDTAQAELLVVKLERLIQAQKARLSRGKHCYWTTPRIGTYSLMLLSGNCCDFRLSFVLHVVSYRANSTPRAAVSLPVLRHAGQWRRLAKEVKPKGIARQDNPNYICTRPSKYEELRQITYKPTCKECQSAMQPKRIGDASILGERGVNLLEGIVLKMGFAWHPTRGTLDAGIDGVIEIRDRATGAMTNLIIQVQSKATARPFTNESPSGFDFHCDQRDIDYWLGGNAPVLLVVSRPDSNEIYWKSLKQYFAEPANRSTRKVHFDKVRDRFDASCADRLVALAASERVGLYLGATPKREVLWSNLLGVRVLAGEVFRAPTPFSHGGAAVAFLKEKDVRLPREWFIAGGSLISFHDLRHPQWNLLCTTEEAKPEPISAWSSASTREQERGFVRLLNVSLERHLAPAVWHRRIKGEHIYFFRPSENLKPYQATYQSAKRRSPVTVFTGYPSKRDPAVMAYYRAHGFWGQFRRYDNVWYLEIEPTYWFTGDGYEPDLFADSRMSKIKEIEGHRAVMHQVLMWADYLSDTPSLLGKKPRFIAFTHLETVAADAGIDDEAWQGATDESREQDADNSAAGAPDVIEAPPEPPQLSLFGHLPRGKK